MSSTVMISELFGKCVLAIARVLLIIMSGVGLNLTGILPGASTRVLSKCVFNVFMPALIFIKMTKSVDLDRISSWWPLVIGPALCTCIGFTSAELIFRSFNRCFRVPRSQLDVEELTPLDALLEEEVASDDNDVDVELSEKKSKIHATMIEKDMNDVEDGDFSGEMPPSYIHEKFVPGPLKSAIQCAASFNNAFSFPLLVVLALVDTLDRFNGDSDAPDRATAYVTFFSCLTSAMMWIIGFSVMKRAAQQIADDHGASDSNTSKWRRCIQSTLFKRLVTPPNVSIVVGLIFGCVPVLKELFIGDSAPLKFITGTCEVMGNGVVPLSLLVLGAKLASFRPQRRKSNEEKNEPPQARVPKRLICAVLISKLLVSPAIMLAFVSLLRATSSLPPNDILFPLIMVIEASSPTAANMVVVADLAGHSQRAVSLFQFGGYVFATLTVSAWCTLILTIF